MWASWNRSQISRLTVAPAIAKRRRLLFRTFANISPDCCNPGDRKASPASFRTFANISLTRLPFAHSANISLTRTYNGRMSRPSLAILSLAALTLAAQTPTIDQSLSMKQIAGVEVSPNGHYVAYVVQQANWDENSFDTQIWIHDNTAGENYQLTTGKKSSQSPRWSPDSRRLAFASERDNKRQIYVISPRGGEAAQLTSEDNGVGSFDWSPDGTKIAFVGSGPDAKSKKDRKDKYGDFEVIGGDYTMQHLWVVAVPQEIPADPKQRPKPDALTK